MALEFGFYDSFNHDRVYNAENMNDIFEGVLTDGVYAGVGDEFHVRPSFGLQVIVGTGRAWFKSTWNKNRTMTPVNLDTPDPVYDRIDTLCIRVQKDILERRNDFYVYKGLIQTTPQPPVIQETDTTFYLPLANITVRANSEDIATSDIDILVGRDPCPYVTSILQQTDITHLFSQWQAQFMDWWQSIKDVIGQIEGGDIGIILSAIEGKLDKDDKATKDDISTVPLPDDKWMTPKVTKSMIDDLIGDKVTEIEDTLKNGVVSSFNGRKGEVFPQPGDYTATQVGALPINGGGAVTGSISVSGSLGTGGNLWANGALTVSGDATIGGETFISNVLNVAGKGNFSGGLHINPNGNIGGALNFGDGDYVHISEATSDNMEIKANRINIVTQNSNNDYFTLNGFPINKELTFTLLNQQTVSVSGTGGKETVTGDGYGYSLSSVSTIYVACYFSFDVVYTKIIYLPMLGSGMANYGSLIGLGRYFGNGTSAISNTVDFRLWIKNDKTYVPRIVIEPRGVSDYNSYSAIFYLYSIR